MFEQQDQTVMQTGGYATADDPVTDSRRAHVTAWNKDFDTAKEFWSPQFKQMRSDQDFARGKQWEQMGNLSSQDMYTANIVQRHIQQRVSALYAKNPTFVAKPKPKIDYTHWDGRAETIAKIQTQLQQAMAVALPQPGAPAAAPAAGGMSLVDPNSLLILEDYNRVMLKRELLRRIGKTLELAFDHYLSEQVVPFKKQMKRVVRRVLTTGVGYVKLDYQRVMQMRPEVAQQLADASQQLATIERLARERAYGDFDDTAADFDRLTTLIKALQQEPGILAREGLTFDYPESTAIIPDTKCTNLDGFQGCDWVAEEFFLSPADIKEVYDVDVRSGFKPYQCTDKGSKRFVAATAGDPRRGDTLQGFASVRVIHCKRDGLVYVTCDGYPDFLKEPAAPEVRLERFWPIFTLMFNETDHEEQVFPISDVYLLRHPQAEYNRSRQALREHRHANRPKTYVGADRLSDNDRGKLESHPANAVIELEGLQLGEKIEDVLQPHKPPPIDAALYDNGPHFDDTMRVVGTQEANLGGTSNATATESSIAESSRLSALDSCVDDLDELLTELARAGGQVLMLYCSQRTIQRICGEGASWPQTSPQDIVEELMLEVAAGSSGRPNKAQEIQNFERMTPLLIQIPGIKPEWLAEEGLRRLNDKLDLSQALAPATPSITALNSAGSGPGMPAGGESDPQAQGPQGQNNAPQPKGTEGDTPGPGRPPMDPNIDRAGLSGITLN